MADGWTRAVRTEWQFDEVTGEWKQLDPTELSPSRVADALVSEMQPNWGMRFQLQREEAAG